MASFKENIIHYSKSLFLGFILLTIALIGLVYYVFTADNEYVPALVCQIVKEELGVEMAFSHLTSDRCLHSRVLL